MRRPITNPTLFDTALPQTKAHAIVMYQNHPDFVQTTLGRLPVGGDLQLYALQLELALNERFSLVASKDGYIEFQPDATFSQTSGWANLAAGAKYAWLYKPECGVASSLQLIYEIPSGDRDVWQGEGDGQFIPSLFFLKKFCNGLQYSNAAGFKLPVDDDAESTMFYTSHHVSFPLNDWLSPVVELNWFHVIDPGDGGARFRNQVGGAVPGVAQFEGGDLINLGALNADDNEDLVTLGLGLRAAVSCSTDLGFAWEFPLTEEEANLMEDRFTVDLEIRF